ncbi:lymphoid-specific helicase-like [Xenia sp. Carnegie-2017]|uniref:lymphoid-specific helicase-like n=1 Tax=Xenia sp. Carnegie-2017 TaxID=2897299 RepID=UPI001F039A61|nr:lymphoid-specific helicase-like [Xenia sp. Carnegie-2017]
MSEEENCDEQVVHERQQKNESEEDKERKLVAQQISDGVLTDSMLREENKLKKENLKEEREIVDKAMTEYDSTVEEQRYARLQHLLKKSDVYSAFLLQRIEEQKQENKKKRLREAKKAEKTQKEVSSPQAVPESKRSRRDKKASSEYNFSDYLDTEALKKSSAESMCAPNKEVNKNLAVSHDSTECASSEVPKKGFVKPKLLTGGELRDYQEEGVEWLKVLFENGVNGILADEMGLGKTVQCIALLAHLVEWGVRGPFLVVAPLSTLPNWLSEFKRFTPNLFASIYHGTPDERAIMRKKFNKIYGVKPYRAMPVIITSYSIVINDSRHLMKYNWKYLIVDEGHRIKDFNCKLIRELKLLPSANRLLLTGTPLQNNLAELWSLLNFLLPDIFNDLESFQAWFDFSAISQSDGDRKIIAQEREHHVLERLHSILTPFLLRRLKTDVSLDIPLKKEVFVYAPLTQLQKVWYRRALDRIELLNYVAPKKETPQSYSATGRARRRCTSMKTDYSVFDRDDLDYEQFVNVQSEQENRKRALRQKALATPDPSFERNIKVLNLYVLLRKVCMHPYLLEYPIDPETQDYRMDEELITSSGKTLLLDQMLPELKRRGHKVLLFSQWTKQLDILQDICYIRDYKYSRIDGDMKFAERQIQIENFNSDQNVFIFLLSTRAGGLGLNLTAADTAIIYDSDWNPQMDLQAQDRCHRIGQTRPVIVYRLITANTIDEKIVEVARDKRRLEKMVIHKERFKGMRTDKALSSKEIMHLLQSCDHNAAINSKEVSSNVLLTKEQLNKLMDRSDMVTDGKSKATAENVDDDEDKALFKVVKSDE